MTDQPNPPTPHQAPVNKFVEKIMQMLREDAADGTIPYAVTDFRDLHSFVDANMYLEHAGQVYEPGNPASLAEINAITDDITRRLQDGELTGGGWSELRWNTTVQHVATVPNAVARRLLRLDPPDSIAASWLRADVDDDVLTEIEGTHSHASVYGREVLDVQPSAERLLTADEVDEIGLDPGGRDGHPGYPHRWTTLTDSQRATLRRLGGTAINAAEVLTDAHVVEHPSPPTSPPRGMGRPSPDRSASPTTSTTDGQENPPMGSAKDIWIDMLDTAENKGRRDATHHGSLPSDEHLWAYARTLPGGDSLSEHPDADMTVELRDAYNVGRQPTRIDLDAVVQAVRAAGHNAFVDMTGGNTATLYAGLPVADNDDDGRLRWSAVAGPGWFEGLGWTRPFADTAEFSVGPDDQGVSDGPIVPAYTYPAQVAALIVEVIEGVERQRVEANVSYASPETIRWVQGDDIADAVARTYERDAQDADGPAGMRDA